MSENTEEAMKLVCDAYWKYKLKGVANSKSSEK